MIAPPLISILTKQGGTRPFRFITAAGLFSISMSNELDNIPVIGL